MDYMPCSSSSAPMADVISTMLVRADMIAISLMIHRTLRIVLYLCLTNHCTPTCNADVSRTNGTVFDVELNLCECHCLIPYALIIYYLSVFVNRVDHLLLKINRIVISLYCVRAYHLSCISSLSSLVAFHIPRHTITTTTAHTIINVVKYIQYPK